MPTTALIVEVLVIGAMTLAWLAALFAAFLPLPTSAQLASLASWMREAVPLLVLPAFALTYAVGWVTNFCSERVLKIFFQRRIRDRQFGDSKQYEMARLMMLQRGSDGLVQDVLVDRHIIRLARGGVVNFTLLGAALSIHALQGRVLAWPFALLCFCLAGLSFAQWLTRYESHYARIKRIGDFLSEETGKLKST